ncbi:hypothetical protein FS842_003022 [Serendipita sp. 407]|nr:hypothetical protein FS842_003022 [Serendipita sp. 407]
MRLQFSAVLLAAVGLVASAVIPSTPGSSSMSSVEIDSPPQSKAAESSTMVHLVQRSLHDKNIRAHSTAANAMAELETAHKEASIAHDKTAAAAQKIVDSRTIRETLPEVHAKAQDDLYNAQRLANEEGFKATEAGHKYNFHVSMMQAWQASKDGRQEDAHAAYNEALYHHSLHTDAPPPPPPHHPNARTHGEPPRQRPLPQLPPHAYDPPADYHGYGYN